MDAITIASVGMQNDILRLNSISQNLANVMTPGYKREIPVSRSFESYMAGTPETAHAAGQPPSIGSNVSIDASAGTLRYSGNPMDVAVDGEGFFEIATDTGLAYTRQGSLHADARGRLVNVQGQAIMGTSGELTVSGAALAIERDGAVKQGERLVGQIKLVRFSNPSALVPLGNGLYGRGATQLADAGVDGAVRAGYQENSNVNSPQEMVRLSETVRHFETMQKIMQGSDDAIEKAIRKLGEF